MNMDDYPYMHILGGLYGQALGDAWGMPAYYNPHQTWTHYKGWLDHFYPAPHDHPFHPGFRAGQVTDDTEQALALAYSIIAEGKITIKGAAKAIITWYDQLGEEGIKYVGPSTRKAITAIKNGVSSQMSGTKGDTNGGAMRISPIGLIHPGDIDAAIEDAIIACTPTHFTDVALSGACAVAAAVAEAMAPDTTLEHIIQAGIQGAELGRQYGTPWLGASVVRKIDAAVRLATDAHYSEYERLIDLYDLIGSTLSPADSVPCAFGVLAMADGDPVQTAIYAAALSGDADTVGAMACAMAGAWKGVEAIPMEYIETIRQANPQYDFEDVAEGLFEIASQNYNITSSQDEKNILNDFHSEE